MFLRGVKSDELDPARKFRTIVSTGKTIAGHGQSSKNVMGVYNMVNLHREHYRRLPPVLDPVSRSRLARLR